jgi:hypothetical protein
MLPWLILGPSVAAYLFLMLRISAFRKRSSDPALKGSRLFGMPPLTWMRLFDREEYDERGRKLLPWLYLSAFASAIGIALILVQTLKEM